MSGRVRTQVGRASRTGIFKPLASAREPDAGAPAAPSGAEPTRGAASGRASEGADVATTARRAAVRSTLGLAGLSRRREAAQRTPGPLPLAVPSAAPPTAPSAAPRSAPGGLPATAAGTSPAVAAAPASPTHRGGQSASASSAGSAGSATGPGAAGPASASGPASAPAPASPLPAVDDSRLPTHIAIIMDGNGRWAQRRGLPRSAGHRAGVRPVRATVEACGELGIRVLTLYAFSTENWKRPRPEVDLLMSLCVEVLDREVAELHTKGVRVRGIGRRDGLPAAVRAALKRAEERTAGNQGLQLVLALNYGGRQEVVDAARRLAREVQAGRLRPEDIDEDRLAASMDTAGLPEPDLLIRCGGEMRLSNFLLWESAYSELLVTPVHWPDFGRADLLAAVAEFQRRQRRFGGLGSTPGGALGGAGDPRT